MSDDERTAIVLVVVFVCLMVLVILLLNDSVWGAEPPLRPLFDALWDVESSKRLNPPDGDGSRAIGPYQIWRIYWQSAIEFAPELGGTYEDCREKGYAEWIILAHWLRFCPAALERYDFETLARTHKGGAKGARDPATLAYWRKVQARLDKGKRKER